MALVLSLFLVSTLCDDNPVPTSTGSGFTHVTLNPQRTTSIALGGRTAVIVDAPLESFNYSLTTSTREIWQHSRPYAHPSLLVSGESLDLRAISRPVEVALWVLPRGLCGAGSAVLTSEHSLSLRSKSSSHHNPLCLFSQATFREAELVASVGSRDKAAKVAFYGARSGDDALKSCELGQRCSVRERLPFFLRVGARANQTLIIKVDYEVEHPAPGVVYCSVVSVPLARDGPYSVIQQVLGGLVFECRSQALDILGILGFGGLALLAVFVILGFFHAMRLVNVGDWMFPDVEKARFSSLKRDRYAAGIGDAHTEDAETQSAS
jgi:hypothetical protein